MKIKLKDINLAMEYVNKNSHSEYVEFDWNEAGGAAMSMSFIDKQSKACKVFLYQSDKGVTPEVRVTTKLYKSE